MKIKTKINKWDLIKLKLLHSKGNHKQDKKTTLRMGENICKQINGQRINLQNIQATHAAQYQEKKKTQSKNGQRASLVAQWLRICLLMQGTRVQALVWEDPTCRGATRPVSHNY